MTFAPCAVTMGRMAIWCRLADCASKWLAYLFNGTPSGTAQPHETVHTPEQLGDEPVHRRAGLPVTQTG